MRIKFLLFAVAISAAIVLFAGCAGGEIFFKATVTDLDEEFVYATATDQDTRIIYRVPKHFRIPKDYLSDEEDLAALQVGDDIRCMYLKDNVDGDLVYVITLSIIE